MNDSDLSPISFTKEKSLWQIYVQSRKIPTSKFNLITTSIVFMAAMTSWLSDQDTAETIRSVRDMSSTCFNASLTILGFLVAGFTIFATLTNARMFIQMGQIRERETNSGLTYLKKSFFILIRVFIYYLLFSVACFFILALGGAWWICFVYCDSLRASRECQVCNCQDGLCIYNNGPIFFANAVEIIYFQHTSLRHVQFALAGRRA
ncbi:hypothetical protein VDR98_21790 [Xanthomonas campestris pv. campestris]|nr:hypothetical protein [Xanthomonas campestris pv. campestris]